MLLVLPYSISDIHLAEALAKYLPHVGPYPAHDLLLAPAMSVKDTVDGIREQLEPIFRKTYTFVVPAGDAEWPLGCQRMFYYTGMHIFQKIPATQGWYYFEPDNVPTRPGWLDELGEEYRSCGRRFMGASAETVWQEIGKDLRRKDGYHLVGTSIYPADLALKSPLFKALRDVKVPFDVFLQHEVMRDGPQITKKIFHEWCTKNYTRDRKTGIIIGELAREYRSWPPRPVPAEAAVVHGCKDMSLINIYRGMLTGHRAQMSVPVNHDFESESVAAQAINWT